METGQDPLFHPPHSTPQRALAACGEIWGESEVPVGNPLDRKKSPRSACDLRLSNLTSSSPSSVSRGFRRPCRQASTRSSTVRSRLRQAS